MNCIICGNHNDEKIFDCLTKCAKCGLIYYNNENKTYNINSLYDEEYFNGNEYFDYKDDKTTIQKNFHRRLRDITKIIKTGRLFEIGCAYGFFLEIARDKFLVSGVDITEKPTEYARKELKLNVKTGNYLDLPVTTMQNIFCMWDTIEHLEKPVEYLIKINTELDPGGYLFMTTGDVGSFLAKIRGRKWRMIHPPTHLFYFSVKTVTELLERNGFEVVKIKHPGVYRSLKQIIYSLFYLNRNKVPTCVEWVMNKIDFSVYINTYDIMMVVAKKV